MKLVKGPVRDKMLPLTFIVLLLVFGYHLDSVEGRGLKCILTNGTSKACASSAESCRATNLDGKGFWDEFYGCNTNQFVTVKLSKCVIEFIGPAGKPYCYKIPRKGSQEIIDAAIRACYKGRSGEDQKSGTVLADAVPRAAEDFVFYCYCKEDDCNHPKKIDPGNMAFSKDNPNSRNPNPGADGDKGGKGTGSRTSAPGFGTMTVLMLCVLFSSRLTF